MSSRTEAGDRPVRVTSVNYLALTFALMGGPLVWLLRLVANSSLVEHSCRLGATWPLWVSTALSTMVAVAALMVSRRYHRLADAAAGSNETARWLGLVAIWMNVLAVAGILLESAPIAVLDVCRQVPG